MYVCIYYGLLSLYLILDTAVHFELQFVYELWRHITMSMVVTQEKRQTRKNRDPDRMSMNQPLFKSLILQKAKLQFSLAFII